MRCQVASLSNLSIVSDGFLDISVISQTALIEHEVVLRETAANIRYPVDTLPLGD
jgi:hypothetical protein